MSISPFIKLYWTSLGNSSIDPFHVNQIYFRRIYFQKSFRGWRVNIISKLSYLIGRMVLEYVKDKKW